MDSAQLLRWVLLLPVVLGEYYGMVQIHFLTLPTTLFSAVSEFFCLILPVRAEDNIQISFPLKKWKGLQFQLFLFLISFL